jgi:hypothetical protein
MDFGDSLLLIGRGMFLASSWEMALGHNQKGAHLEVDRHLVFMSQFDLFASCSPVHPLRSVADANTVRTNKAIVLS